jgi:hypothetical protein
MTVQVRTILAGNRTEVVKLTVIARIRHLAETKQSLHPKLNIGGKNDAIVNGFHFLDNSFNDPVRY